MTNTAKMTARIARSANSTYTFTIRQRMIDAQWEWVLTSGNRLPILESRPFSTRSICFANIEKVKRAFIDGRVVIKEDKA